MPEQWEQLDEQERQQVAEQVAGRAREFFPDDIKAPADDSVSWEEWDSGKYSEAWTALTKVAADPEGGGEEGLKREVEALLGRGWRPVHAAAQHGQLQQLDVLLEFLGPLMGGSSSSSSSSSSSKSTSKTKTRKKKKTKKTKKHPPVELLQDEQGLTALHLAALAGELEAMKRLLPVGKLRPKARAAQVNPEDRHGSRPLHLATGAGQLAAMRLLLASGADAEARTRAQATPLHVAASGGQLEAMELLLGEEVWAHPLAEDVQGANATDIAVRNGQPAAVALIDDAVKRRIKSVYEGHMPPDKRGRLPALLEQYRGKEAELLVLVEGALEKTKEELAHALEQESNHADRDL